MVSYNTNLKSWGATGTEPPTGYNYAADEPPVDEFDNWVNNNVIDDLLHLTNLTNARIESEKGTSGGEPSSPEASHIYHDQDNERLEVWDGTSSAWRGLLYKDGDTLSGALNMGNYALNDVGDINDKNGSTIWDTSAGYIPQGRLQNDSLTVAGNAVSLGGSTTVNHGDLADAPADAHHSQNHDNSDHTTNYLAQTNYTPVSDVNAETSLTVDITGDADTLDGNHADDLGVGIEDSGTVVVSPSTAIDFTGYLNVTDDGDGTVTVDPSHTHSLGDLSNVTATGEGSGNGFDADTVDGTHSSGLAKLSDGVQAPVYATLADVPNTISKGEMIFNDADGSLYVEDGT